MFAWFYTAAIYIGLALAHLVALFHPKTRRWVAGQTTQWPKDLVASHKNPTVWFHAASLGEFEQGRPVIEAFRQQYPQYRIWLTFFSPSGYELRKNYDGADVVTYLPADTPTNVKQFLEQVQPVMVFFIKYEFWYHYLTQLRRRHIPTYLISAIFRPNQLFFKPYGGFYRQILFCFQHIFVQNEVSTQLLAQVGYTQVTHAGDTRLDRVVQLAQQTKPLPIIESFKNHLPLLIVGSAWPDDMQVLIEFLNHWSRPLRVLIAPHEISPTQIATWQKQLRWPSQVYTQLPANPSFDSLSQHPEILFFDTVGLLAHTYQHADFVYIGGAFGDGLHNILEPAVFGAPLFFGCPHYDKFQEANDLLESGGAQAISTALDLQKAFEEVYHNPVERQRRGGLCQAYVQQYAGATARIMKHLSTSA